MLTSRALTLYFILLLLGQPAAALVEPEIEAWQEYVRQVEDALPFWGSEIVVDAALGVGETASRAVAAPLASEMAQLEQRRNLKFKYFTPWHVKTKSQLRDFLKLQIEKEYPPEVAAEEEAFLKALGLVPMDFNIRSFTEDLLTDAVGGAYDPSTDQFFLVDTETGQGFRDRMQVKASRVALGDMNSILIIHELDHALGGQHFPFKDMFEKLLKEATLDQQLAVMALLEGDASFVMFDHQQNNPPEAAGANMVFAGSDMLTDMVLNFPIPLPGMGQMSKAPVFFQRSLIFPYYGGAEFVSTLRHIGESWEEVDAAYSVLPQSTQEIFHPYRYLMAAPPDYPDFSRLPDPFGEWVKVKDEVGGEFLVRVVLEQYGIKEFHGPAAGWNGDRIRIYRNKKTGALGFYWAIRWDDPEEAREFYEVLGSHLPFVVEQEELTSIISLAFDEKQLAQLRKSWK
ncbi:MAG: hypothetical protein WC314_25920 [Vulcanimicrobiota bacterium]